jgi:leader peptidase (prepilin peptidase)/N-methyltransferase
LQRAVLTSFHPSANERPACLLANEKADADPLICEVGHYLMNPGICLKAIPWLVAPAAVYVSIVSAPGVIGLLGAGLAVVAIVIVIIDWRSYIIPDGLNAAGLALGLLHAAALTPEFALWGIAVALMRGAMLALMFLAIRVIYAKVRGRQGLGLGDIKLAAVAGAWLDWIMMPVAIELAVMVALCGYVIQQYILSRPISLTNKVPFGAFLAPAIWVSWVLETTWLRAL